MIFFHRKALPKDPALLQADTLPGSPSESGGSLSESPGRRTASVFATVDDYDQAVSTDEVLCEVDLSVCFHFPHLGEGN